MLAIVLKRFDNRHEELADCYPDDVQETRVVYILLHYRASIVDKYN